MLRPFFTALRKRKFLFWLTLAWTVILIAGSLSPAETKTAIGTTRSQELPGHQVQNLPPGDLKHRMFHWGSFGLTAYLYMSLAEAAGAELTGALSAAALGIVIEIAQYCIYYIRFEWDDVWDDTLAVAVVYFVVMGYRRLLRDKRKPGRQTTPAN